MTPDGTCITLVRFESEEAARRNSERPEQGRWWAEMAELYTGEVTFHDSTDVALGFGGGSDDAGFVQVVQGRTGNVERMREMNAQPLTSPLWQLRPDLTGWILALHGGGYFTQALYFTSEQPAREGEGREPSPEMKAQLDEEMSSTLSDTTFHDLREQRVPLATGSPSQRPTRRMEAGPHLPTDRRHDRRAPGRPRRPTRTRSHRRRLNVGRRSSSAVSRHHRQPTTTLANRSETGPHGGLERNPPNDPAPASHPEFITTEGRGRESLDQDRRSRLGRTPRRGSATADQRLDDRGQVAAPHHPTSGIPASASGLPIDLVRPRSSTSAKWRHGSESVQR